MKYSLGDVVLYSIHCKVNSTTYTYTHECWNLDGIIRMLKIIYAWMSSVIVVSITTEIKAKILVTIMRRPATQLQLISHSYNI